MRVFLRLSLLALATILLPVRGGSAAPLDSKQIAADAQWVIHVDLDALRDSRAGKFIRENCLATNDGAQKAVKKILDDSGVDLTKDLHDVTVYDNQFVEFSGVAILRASHINNDKLLARFKADHPDHKTSEHGKHVLYTWKEKGGKRHREHQMTAAAFGDDAAVFSRDAKQVEHALDVLDGKSESLPATSKLAEATPAGTFLTIRGIGMDQKKTPFHVDLISKSKQISVVFGQHDAELFADELLVSQDAETAAKVQKAVDGLRAMAELRFGNDAARGKEVKALLQGLKVETKGDTVTLQWRADGKDVAELIKKEHQRFHRLHEAHKHHRDAGPDHPKD